jgi:hypothetical protein
MSLDSGITHLASWGGNTIMPTLSGLFFAGAVYRYSKGGAYGQFLYGDFGALMCSGTLRTLEGFVTHAGPTNADAYYLALVALVSYVGNVILPVFALTQFGAMALHMGGVMAEIYPGSTWLRHMIAGFGTLMISGILRSKPQIWARAARTRNSLRKSCGRRFRSNDSSGRCCGPKTCSNTAACGSRRQWAASWNETESYLNIDRYLYSIVSLKELPDATFPGMLQRFSSVGFPLVISGRVTIPDQVKVLKGYKTRLKKMVAAQKDSDGNHKSNPEAEIAQAQLMQVQSDIVSSSVKTAKLSLSVIVRTSR